MKSADSPSNDRPLCVDLDGTLLATDVLWESLLILFKRRPFLCLLLPFWLLRGKAYFKQQIAERVELNPASLPYRVSVLSLLQEERAGGREIVLATATDRKFAEKIAEHLGIFSAVLASDGRVNLSGRQKLHALENHSAGRGFDYAGDADVDLPLWQAAHHAILVNPSSRLLKRAQNLAEVHRVITAPQNRVVAAIKALRPHQWIKNFLLCVPLAMAHKIGEIAVLFEVFNAFISYSLCASGVYILNDLVDLESDRMHPRKRNRPFASGALPIKVGVILSPALLLISSALAALTLPPLFCLTLMMYFWLTTIYSLYLKSVLILDVIVLAGLYAFRVLAGSIAVEVPISPWLLTFSIFFFLSLAMVKRYSELRMLQESKLSHNQSRGYLMIDIEPLRSIGPASGYLSVLVFTLYTNSREVTLLYKHPIALWLIGPLLLYWVTRIWFLAHRGKVDDDPIMFAVKDPMSYAIGAAIMLIMFAAS